MKHFAALAILPILSIGCATTQTQKVVLTPLQSQPQSQIEADQEACRAQATKPGEVSSWTQVGVGMSFLYIALSVIGLVSGSPFAGVDLGISAANLAAETGSAAHEARAGEQFDLDTYRACMEGRGYSISPLIPPAIVEGQEREPDSITDRVSRMLEERQRSGPQESRAPQTRQGSNR